MSLYSAALPLAGSLLTSVPHCPGCGKAPEGRMTELLSPRHGSAMVAFGIYLFRKYSLNAVAVDYSHLTMDSEIRQ